MSVAEGFRESPRHVAQEELLPKLVSDLDRTLQSAADEECFTRERQAAELLAVLPVGAVKVAGKGPSRISALEVGSESEVASSRLITLGGKSGEKNSRLRLFLQRALGRD